MANARLPIAAEARLDHRQALKVWLAPLAVFLLVYGYTCQRTVSWQDSGTYQHQVRMQDYPGKEGIARAHPTYVAVASAFGALDVGSFYWRVNLVSGVAMALAVANLALAVYLLTRLPLVALAAGGIYGVMHISWWLGTIAEVYTLSVAGLTAELVLLIVLLTRPRVWVLVALAFVNGLGWGVHNFSLLVLPVYLAATAWLIIRRDLPVRALPVAAAAWLIGAGPNLYLFYLEMVEAGLDAAVHSALFGRHEHQVLNAMARSKHLKANMALSALSFAGFVVPLAIVGWVRCRRWLSGPAAICLGAITLIHVVFFIRYPVPDQFTFLLPSATMIALAGGLGLAVLAASPKPLWRRAGALAALLSILIPPVLYALAPRLLDVAGIRVTRRRELMHRDEARYWLVPWKHNERSAHRYARDAFAQVEATPNPVIIADSTALPVLQLAGQDLSRSEVGVYSSIEPLMDDPPGRDLLPDRAIFSTTPEIPGLDRALGDHVRTDRPPSAPLWRVRPATGDE